LSRCWIVCQRERLFAIKISASSYSFILVFEVEKFIFAHFFADGTLGRAWPRLRAEGVGHRFFFRGAMPQETKAKRNRRGRENNEDSRCLIHKTDNDSCFTDSNTILIFFNLFLFRAWNIFLSWNIFVEQFGGRGTFIAIYLQPGVRLSQVICNDRARPG